MPHFFERVAVLIALAFGAVALAGVVGAIVTDPARQARNAEAQAAYIRARCLDSETHADRLRWCGTPPSEAE